MNKTEFIQAVRDQSGLSLADASRAIDATLNVITAKLIEGEAVNLIGFGKFETSVRQERTGRNPKTGARLTIPASTTVKFVPGKALKDAVN